MVAAEEREEARLGAGGPLDSPKPEGLKTVLDLVQVEDEVVTPEAGPFPHSHELGRLKVRETQRRQIAPLVGEAPQSVDDADQTIAKQTETIPHEQEIGVVGDVAAGRTQMNDVSG